MAEDVGVLRPKKQRILQLGASTAMLGYHYEGEKCLIVNGKPTLRLRRDKEGPREDTYGDYGSYIFRPLQPRQLDFSCL